MSGRQWCSTTRGRHAEPCTCKEETRLRVGACSAQERAAWLARRPPPVREIGAVEDFDGATVRIGVDYGTVTIRSGAQPSRFGPGGRAEFERLWAEAGRAAEAWLDNHPEDRET